MSKNNSKGFFNNLKETFTSKAEERTPESVQAPPFESIESKLDEAPAVEETAPVAERKQKPASSYSDMLRIRADEAKQRSLKFRRNGEAKD
jgi:hypothetical protein